MNTVQKPLTVRELHAIAMDFTEKAIASQKLGEHSQASEYYLDAYNHEKLAAEKLIPTSLEPTRSILLRSAATLALDCKLNREAEKLIAIALAGEPPPELADDLRDLFERVNFERHLVARGISLQRGELQLSLTGEEVSFGMVPSDLAIERVQDAQSLLIRTAERKIGIPYRRGGKPSSEIQNLFNVYLSTPRAASFAVTLRLGSSPELFGQQDEIIDEVISCIKLVNDNDASSLKEKIQDEYYFDNFVGLSRKIAPDGKKIKMVGFTANSNGSEKSAMLTTPKRKISIDRPNVIQFPTQSNDIVEIVGKLGYADSFRRDNIVKIRSTENAITWTVYVPEGLIDDVVIPYWDKIVRVRGNQERDNGIITMRDISPID